MTVRWSDDLAGIGWDELSELYRLAPLGDKPPADLKLVFGNSKFFAFAFDADRLVGAGRALADGRDCAYLCDIAVLPSHRGQGLGRQIVERLVGLLAQEDHPVWRSRNGSLLRGDRLPPHDDGNGDF